MILASIEGTILAIIVGIVMVVVRWISDRAARQQAEQEQRHRQERRSSAGPVKPDSEEERMRRFMEALGIPADGASTPPPPPPPVRQPPVRREPTIRPVPPIISTSRERTEPRREMPVPPPMPQYRPVTPPPAPAPRVESRPVAPEFPPLKVEMPQLPSFAQEAFQTTSSSISAIPEDIASKSSKRPEVQELAPAIGGEGELWRVALRSPEALRSAFILKEILGTPRGLQSGGVAHSFPSL